MRDSMELLHIEEDRVILRLTDGTILTVFDDAVQMKCIPGRRKSERKYMELKDLYIVNDALKEIYPECQCNDRNKAL